MAILGFIKEFAAVINTALLISFLGIFYYLFLSFKSSKQAEIVLLNERNETLKLFSAENVNKQITNLKEWHKESINQLELEKEKALKAQQIDYKRTLEAEIIVRNELNEKLKITLNKSTVLFEPILDQFIGEYSVIGYNPGDLEGNDSYFGNLTIDLKNSEIAASWKIEGGQIFNGVGLIYGNQLSICYYEDNTEDDFHGVISYIMLSSSILRGRWTANGSNGRFGIEECRKLL